jgi:hypothetical protein
MAIDERRSQLLSLPLYGQATNFYSHPRAGDRGDDRLYRVGARSQLYNSDGSSRRFMSVRRKELRTNGYRDPPIDAIVQIHLVTKIHKRFRTELDDNIPGDSAIVDAYRF